MSLAMFWKKMLFILFFLKRHVRELRFIVKGFEAMVLQDWPHLCNYAFCLKGGCRNLLRCLFCTSFFVNLGEPEEVTIFLSNPASLEGAIKLSLQGKLDWAKSICWFQLLPASKTGASSHLEENSL